MYEIATYEILGDPDNFGKIEKVLNDLKLEYPEQFKMPKGPGEIEDEDGCECAHFHVSFPFKMLVHFIDAISLRVEEAGAHVFMYSEDCIGIGVEGDEDGEEGF